MTGTPETDRTQDPLAVTTESNAASEALAGVFMTEDSAASKGRSVYSSVQEQLGIAVCSGRLASGLIVTAESVEEMSGVSRSTVRECLRVLASLGLLRARKRLGFQVLPEDHWNIFDRQVIRWQLMSNDRDRHVRTLQEARLAFEPEAARLAAQRCSPELAGRIMGAAGKLLSSGACGKQDEFVQDDSEFHRLVLYASGNALFTKLSDVLHEALRERTVDVFYRESINTDDLQLHVELAAHIQRGHDERAGSVMRDIIVRTMPDTEASPVTEAAQAFEA